MNIRTWMQQICTVCSLLLSSHSTYGQEATSEEPHADVRSASTAPFDDLPDLVAKARRSVVTIISYGTDDKRLTQGTGFFVAPRELVTARHVIEGAYRAEFKLPSGELLPVKAVLADDEKHDIVLLLPDVKEANIPHLQLGATKPRDGERIVIIGSPFGLGQTISDGIVSSLRTIPDVGEIIQTTAAISPGSSGSPLINMQGQVIGVAISQVVDGQSLNFAVPIKVVGLLTKRPPLSLRAWQERFINTELDRGLDAFAESDFEKALAHLQKAVKADPQHPKAPVAWSQIGHSLIELRRYQEAVNELTKAIKIYPNYENLYWRLAEANRALAHWEDAIAAYRQVIRINPDDYLAYYFLAEACSPIRRWNDAIQASKQLIRLRPNDAHAYRTLGRFYESVGKWNDAIKAYKDAMRIEPRETINHWVLGAAYEHGQRWEDALAVYKDSVRIEPKESAAIWRMGLMHEKIHQWDEAIQAFERCLQLHPDDNAEMRYLIGRVQLKNGNKDAAIEQYRLLKEVDEHFAADLHRLIYK